MNPDLTPKRRTGFAAMSAERRQEVARLGGKAQPDHKRAFHRDPELASRAGRLGGLKRHQNRQEGEG